MSATRVGIAGLGTVGAEVARLLLEGQGAVGEANLTLVAVTARDRAKDRGVDLSGVDWEDSPASLAARDDLDIVVELVGGEDGAARECVEAALAKGRRVVTANKALLAVHGASLATLGGSLHYEAAVAGGIPVIKALREGLAANRIERVSGILNGTCNYILTRMEHEGLAFADVLKDAQAQGYAEADPTADVGGWDAAHKLTLLAAIAFGRTPTLDGVGVEGIERVAAEDIAFAREMGLRVRLLGLAERAGGGIACSVEPCLVPMGAPLATIEGVTNAVSIEGEPVGTIVLVGPGAGGGATASAVVADILDAARGNAPPAFGTLAPPASPAGAEGRDGAFYLRLALEDRPGALASVAEALGEEGVSIQRMRQADHTGPAAPVVIVTHGTSLASLRAAVARIDALPVSLQPPVTMRLLEQ